MDCAQNKSLARPGSNRIDGMPFDLDSEARRQLGYKLIDRIDEYFSGLAQRPVQLPEELRTFTDLGDPLPEFGEDAATVLDNLCSEMMAQGFHVPSANYFGLMNPTPTYMAVLAEALVAALNPQLATWPVPSLQQESSAKPCAGSASV